MDKNTQWLKICLGYKLTCSYSIDCVKGFKQINNGHRQKAQDSTNIYPDPGTTEIETNY
jgi:hypothetical protein